jgi:tripartite-type tricarboxylate transporter receptor subunit TctC
MNKTALLLFLLAWMAGAAVSAPPYPVKPIRFIVPFTAGGGSDVMARLLGQALSARLGVAVVVDNRDGASTIVGTDIAAKSPPDGYTLYLGNNSSFAINPALAYAVNPGIFGHLPYDAMRDFSPITLIAKAPFALVVNPAVPAVDLRQLIELARARPGQFNYASGGIGVAPHLAGELLKNMAKIDIVLVTYRGAAQMMTAVMGGEVQMTFTNIATALPQIRAGKLRAIAVTGLQRSSALPDIQTIDEVNGLKGYEAGVWYGVVAPANTPRDIIARLNLEIRQVMQDAKLRERLGAAGVQSVAELAGLANGAHARVAGIVVTRQRPATASGVTFLTLEDESGHINVIVWRELGRQQRQELVHAQLLEVRGELQRESGVTHLIAGRLTDRSRLLGALLPRSRDFH